jgi:hypothetical protein
LAIGLSVVGCTPFPGASCYPTTVGRDRAAVRSVNGWVIWIWPTRNDQAGQRGEGQEEHPGLVDAERLDLRASVPSTAAMTPGSVEPSDVQDEADMLPGVNGWLRPPA